MRANGMNYPPPGFRSIKKTCENRIFSELFLIQQQINLARCFQNFSTPFTFIFTAVTLSTGPVMNKSLLF
jgi:hypothetical protein